MGLCEPKQRQKPWDVSVLFGAVVNEVRDQGRVQQPLGVLPEGICGLALVACRVLYQALDECQYVGLAVYVAERVVVVRP